MYKLLLLASLSAFIFSNAREPGLFDLVTGDDNFSTLATALNKAGLVDVVKKGEFTVLAPTNKAFEKVPKELLADLLKPENKDELVAVLTYHVLPGSGKTVDRLLAGKRFETAQGQPLEVAFQDGRVRVNGAAIVETADLAAANGVVHVIDSVLLPPPSAPGNLAEVAKAAGNFETLLAAARAADLVGALTGKDPLTVFAPTDEAFAALPKGTLDDLLKPENKDRLAGILKYHVVPGSVSAGDALNARQASTLTGQSLAFRFENGALRVGEARILAVDIEAANGTIHVIDQVLLPPAKKTSASLDQARKLIEIAIQHGVPIYNDGDTAGCATVYLHASRKIVADHGLASSVRSPLLHAIDRAGQNHSARSRAWILRHGLDTAYAAIESVGSVNPSASPSTKTAAAADDVSVLMDFNGPEPGKSWKTVNDNVMGGRSRGGPSFGNGLLVFSGSTNTDGGGFSSIRTEPRDWNITDADGLAARVRADGRTYQFDIRKRGASGWVTTAYRAEIATEKTSDWQEVRVPFSAFKPTRFGQPVSGKSVGASDVGAIGLFIYDKQDGPFQLEVDWIGTYSDSETTSTSR